MQYSDVSFWHVTTKTISQTLRRLAPPIFLFFIYLFFFFFSWYVTGDTWQLTYERWWTLCKNIRSLAMMIWDLWCFEDLEEKNNWLNQWINDGGVCTKALTTAGQLTIKICNYIRHYRKTLWHQIDLFEEKNSNISWHFWGVMPWFWINYAQKQTILARPQFSLDFKNFTFIWKSYVQNYRT